MAEDGAALTALARFDKLFDHRIRLAIGVLLRRRGRISFSRFKELLGETDGSLGAHLQRLEEAGYVRVTKAFVARRPTTWYTLTGDGRRALDRHLTALEELTRHASVR